MRTMNPTALNSRAAEVERFIKAIASKPRLMILCELRFGERSVTSIQESISISQPCLSQHLARLRAEKLVKTRRDMQTIYYSLSDDKISPTIDLLAELFCSPARKNRKNRKY